MVKKRSTKMIKEYTLTLTKKQYDELCVNLFPGDNKESISFAVCGLSNSLDKTRVLINKLYHVPLESCFVRTDIRITWNTECLIPVFDKACLMQFSVLKIHSHPTGVEWFSKIDDESDIAFARSFYTWSNQDKIPAISAIMQQNKKIVARIITPDFKFIDCSKVGIIGDDIDFNIINSKSNNIIPEYAMSHGQAFGSGTMDTLQELRVAVVGCSGLGSPVVEQLARLGVGQLVLVDHDIIEERNLNRILNSTCEDARKKTKKVSVLKRAIDAMGLNTKVFIYDCDLENINAIKAVASCDVAFGCMDGTTGRHLLNRICTYYSIPYFDTGVKLEADGKGNVDQVVGAVHYFQPGMSSFFTRNIFSQETLYEELMQKNEPDEYKKLLEQKYIKGVVEHRLAVISVNMLYAALAVNEFLARIHQYRIEENCVFQPIRQVVPISSGLT
jgi:hypothetical protein